MKERMLTMAIKPFLPQIKELAAPAINDFFIEILKKAEDTLCDGEAYAGILILKNKSDETFIVTVAMSEDDRVLRKIASVSTHEFMNEILKKL